MDFNSNLNNLFTNYQNQQNYKMQKYDVNGDGKINSKDQTALNKEKTELLKNKNLLFDVNGDGQFTQADVDMFVKGDFDGDGETSALEEKFVKQYKNSLEVGWSATYNNGSSPFDSVDSSSAASYEGISSNSSNQTFIYNDYQSIQDSAVPLSSINFGEVSLGRQELPEVIYVAPGDDIRWDPTDFLDLKDIHIEGGSEGKYLVLDPTTNTYYAADSSGSVFADGGDDSDWNAISVDRLLSEDTEIDTK